MWNTYHKLIAKGRARNISNIRKLRNSGHGMLANILYHKSGTPPIMLLKK